ncbi:uncharacterized protein LOC130988011 isoform X2 [Salvia miltiorrhiza]|uniref:uncharacterized protein LOC130988011 isoform X2 n=1 Tax=Salvia miltiorrhiza TaxID=226208 RepID=UPI0025AC3C5B|nr:uncharacterized protein LOC130988011 isoform X2 [Salvia miltiorrhiza]
MVLLCFVLDLRSLSPPVLRDLKQSLLQLANYYAVSSPKVDYCVDGTQSNSKPLPDRIGLCYIVRNRITCSDELKIAYNPQGKFSLRDLHRALNNLPLDTFCPESNDSEGIYLKLADVLSEKTVYTWGGQDKTVKRKVILISSSLVGALDPVTMKALTDAADKCVLVEFILLEQTSSQLSNNSENVNQFVKQIGSLTNCSFQTCVPGLQVLYGLGKRWFQELKDDKDVPLQAHFIFKSSLMSSCNQISCNLCVSFNPTVDEFNYCQCILFLQTCRCHGIPLDHSSVHQSKKFYYCPVTHDNLGSLDINENSVRVGEQTILYMPSFYDRPKLKKVTSIDFDVIQRTNLGSLDEGLIMGAAYYVTPTSLNSDESNNSELNCQLFQVVCRVLKSLDQGLVCSSTCNIETATDTSFRFFYILLPSDKGLMLLRRLSASEELLPMLAYNHLTSSSVLEEMESAVRASLLKVEVSDYNPVQHERGFHKKLNMLVKESLQFGAILPQRKEQISTSDFNVQSSELQPSKPAAGNVVTGDEPPESDTKLGENRSRPSLAEEWEQLIVTELGSMHSPTCIANTKLDQPVVASPSQSSRQLDEKTSRILERLEVPKQLKRKAASPTISCSFSADVCGPVKKPLIPYRTTDSEDQGSVFTQPIKPNFQRLKRKK